MAKSVQNNFTAADELETMGPSNPRDWRSHLSQETFAELLEIRRRFQDGKYTDKSMTAIHKFCRKRFADLQVGITVFRDWLRETLEK